MASPEDPPVPAPAAPETGPEVVPETAPEASGWDLQFSAPDRAIALATAGILSPDATTRGWSALLLATFEQRFGQPDAAATLLGVARSAFPDARPDNVRARWIGAALAAHQAFVEGRFEPAVVLAEGLLATPPAPGCESDLHLVYSTLSFCHKRLGNFESGLRWMYTGLAHAREQSLQPQLAIVLLNLSAYLMSIDEWREAEAHLQEAAGLTAGFDNHVLTHRIELNLALCARFLDDDERALRLMERALADPRIDAGSSFTLYGNAASLYVKLGRLDEARRAQEQAWRMARATPSPLWLANCLHFDAQIAAAEGQLADAIAALEQAAVHAEQVTEVQVAISPLILRLLAECHARQGDFERAYQAHQRFHAAHEARLGYTQRVRFVAERTRHGVETLRLELDRARMLQQQSERAQRELAGVNAALAARIAEVEALQEKLQEQAIRDPLTGLFNRRYWDTVLPARVAFAARTGRHLAVAQIDLDHFKRVNDTHGHAGGDEVLRAFGALLMRSARASDLVCRIGGEEFCVMFEDTGLDTAAARLRGTLAAWSALTITLQDIAVEGLAFSAGVALFPDDGTDPDELLRRADARMYEAKRAGRARVFAADA